MSLRAVPLSPIGYCMPWHGRDRASTEPMHGTRCCFCNREVAAPESVRGKHVGCLYCGFDNGDLPLLELEPCRCPGNGLYLAGVDYNNEPYPANVGVFEFEL